MKDTSQTIDVNTRRNPFQDYGNGGNKDFFAPQIPKLNFGRRQDTQHYTPWLIVRVNYSDFGDRPLAGGSVFWESPDVWVQSSMGINQPVVGEENTVYARVSNFGLQYATGIMVKFWWADPSLAITEATANLIGIGYVNVPSGWSVDVKCPNPWIPVFENGGHECLIAEAFLPVSDPLTAPMDPMDDRHVGQKNEQLIMLKKGESFITKVRAINITDKAQDLRFDVQTIHLESIHPLLKIRAADLPVNAKPSNTKLPLAIKFNEGASTFISSSVLFAEKLLLRGLEKIENALLDSMEHCDVTHTAKFEPGESRILEISGKVPDDAETGQTFLFRVIERIGIIVVGGYTVHVVVV
jgi:hypothetical protein